MIRLIPLAIALLIAVIAVIAACWPQQPRMEVNWWRAQNCLYGTNPETKEGYGEPVNPCPRIEQDI